MIHMAVTTPLTLNPSVPPSSPTRPCRIHTKHSGVKPFAIHPTVLNLTLATPPSVTNIAKGAVDIIVPSTMPLAEKDWDLLDEAVIALEGCWGHGEEGKPKPGKIVICESETERIVLILQS